MRMWEAKQQPLEWVGPTKGPVPVLSGIVAAFALCFALFILGLNGAFIAAEGTLVKVGLPLFALAAACFLLYRLKANERAVFYLLLGLGFALRLSMILCVPTEPGSDFRIFYDGARSIVDGVPGWTEHYYFVLYPNLIPICYYYAGLISLFDSLLFLKLTNLLWMTGIHALLYLTAARLFDRRAARVPTLLYALSPAVLLTATQLTNQHISLFFMLLGLYLFLRRPSLPMAALSGGLIALGNQFRSEGIVLYLSAGALMLLFIIDAWGKRDKQRLSAILMRGGAFFLSVFVCTTLLSGLFTRASGRAVSNGSSYQWKLIVGLDDGESGTFSDAHLEEYSTTWDGWAIVKRQLSDGRDWGDFFMRKMRVMWAYPEDPVLTFWNIDGNTRVQLGPLDTDVNGLLRRGLLFDRAVYLLSLLLFAGAAGLSLFRKRLRSPGETLLLLIYCANFSAYLLIEAAPRYRYFILPFLLIYAAAASGKRSFPAG